MPFTFRDKPKPKLSDRLRGKSGEELFNELRSDWDKDRGMFFDTPAFGNRRAEFGTAFPRGFPFEEERGRTNIRSYLDDLASRHPEFADQLRGPPWSEEAGHSPFDRKRRGSGSTAEEETIGQPSSSIRRTSQDTAKTEAEEPRQNLNQFGLRNTVPLGPGVQSDENRKQRSMSAPPDHRGGEKPKRFQTKCEITMQDPLQSQGKPPVAPRTAEGQQQQQQGGSAQSNGRTVRLIPIQVEGRDAPIVNSNLDAASAFGTAANEPQFREPSFEGRLPRDFGQYQKHSPRFSQQHTNQFYQAPPSQQPAQQPPPQQQQQQAQGQPVSSTDMTDAPSAPSPTPQKVEPKDPICKVQLIQKEVDELLKQVESFNGNSRTDKQYMFLDEMLTRNLIKLDDIETEGKENVRQARKDTIRSIQRCINLLESKVPSGESKNEDVSIAEEAEQDGEKKENDPQPMDVDKTKENTPVPDRSEAKCEESQMDVDGGSCTQGKAPQQTS